MKISKEKLEIQMANACMNAYDVCAKVNLKYPTFSKARRGEEVKPATAGKIAKALEVPVEELLES